MRARLVGVSGPLAGRVFAVAQDEFSIGRLATSDLVLADEQASRRHCAIRRGREGFVLSDLETRNGTRVNGEPVSTRALGDGDRLGIGGSEFVFVLDPAGTGGAPNPLVLADDSDPPAPSLAVPAPEAGLFEAASTLDALPNALRSAPNLGALLRISAAMSSVRGVEALEREILSALLDLVPAERAGIVVADRAPGEVVASASCHRDAGVDRPVRASRTVVQKVLGERVALVCNEVLGGPELGAVESLRTGNVRALLCVPMVLHGRATGAIYLDTTIPGRRFEAEHLELAMAVASLAAVALDNARRNDWLEAESARLRSDADGERELLGESAAMHELLGRIGRAARSDATVLLRGESGTGKELVARALHRASARAAGSFVPVNCAAIPEHLLESELFGHERGAFSGAHVQKRGKIELADGGTLFLDEIGELAPGLQAKLLRVLEEREVERVGATRARRVDLRVVAATNADLEKATAAGRFRPDLYYRLNVVALTLPPLRERRTDIVPLARRFAERFGRKLNRPCAGLTPEALARIESYHWPGNVRELRNAIERAVVLGEDEWIGAEDLPEALLEGDPEREGETGNYHGAIVALKRRLIRRALADADGNVSEAARSLGVHVNYLHRLLRNLRLRTEPGP